VNGGVGNNLGCLLRVAGGEAGFDWLRKRKITAEGSDVPATTMPAVRRALNALADLDLDLWSEDGGPSVRVNASGEIFIVTHAGPESLSGARPLDPDMFDLIAPFETPLARGPDLQAPRPNLRIVPGKLSGSPHIVHSRIETVTVAALASRGFDTSKIQRLYPNVRPIAFAEAVDLEKQLAANLLAAA
jgi:uncharacterized protein (DUF433 family)